MKIALLKEIIRMQKIAGILKEEDDLDLSDTPEFKPSGYKPGIVFQPEIYNDGEHRLVVVWEPKNEGGTLAIVDDYNGEDWNVVWQESNLMTKLPVNLEERKIESDKEDDDLNLSDTPEFFRSEPIETFFFGYDSENIEDVQDYVLKNYKVEQNREYLDNTVDAIIWIAREDELMNALDVHKRKMLEDETLMNLIKKCNGGGKFDLDAYQEEDDEED